MNQVDQMSGSSGSSGSNEWIKRVDQTKPVMNLLEEILADDDALLCEEDGDTLKTSETLKRKRDDIEKCNSFVFDVGVMKRVPGSAHLITEMECKKLEKENQMKKKMRLLVMQMRLQNDELVLEEGEIIE